MVKSSPSKIDSIEVVSVVYESDSVRVADEGEARDAIGIYERVKNDTTGIVEAHHISDNTLVHLAVKDAVLIARRANAPIACWPSDFPLQQIERKLSLNESSPLLVDVRDLVLAGLQAGVVIPSGTCSELDIVKFQSTGGAFDIRSTKNSGMRWYRAPKNVGTIVGVSGNDDFIARHLSFAVSSKPWFAHLPIALAADCFEPEKFYFANGREGWQAAAIAEIWVDIEGGNAFTTPVNKAAVLCLLIDHGFLHPQAGLNTAFSRATGFSKKTMFQIFGADDNYQVFAEIVKLADRADDLFQAKVRAVLKGLGMEVNVMAQEMGNDVVPMTKQEAVLCGHLLAGWDDGLTFDDVLAAMRDDNQYEKYTLHEHVDGCRPEDIAAILEELNDALVAAHTSDAVPESNNEGPSP